MGAYMGAACICAPRPLLDAAYRLITHNRERPWCRHPPISSSNRWSFSRSWLPWRRALGSISCSITLASHAAGALV